MGRDDGLYCDVLSSGVNLCLVEDPKLLFNPLLSIQRTSRQSLKMGRGDEQKSCDALYLMVINIGLRSSEIPPIPNSGTFKSMCWTFACRLNIL